MHPLLLPGTHVLRRADGGVQLGLDPATASRLTPDTVSADDLAPRRGSPALRSGPVREELVADGSAAPDDTPLRSALPADREGNRWPRHTLSALFRDDPAQMTARVLERSSKRFRVRGFGHPLDDTLRDDLLAVLGRAGLTPDGPKPPGPPPRHQVAPEHVHVLLGVGEPRRSLADPLLREAVPHLVVRLTEGRLVLGPFVLPGLTPCLRCIDARRTRDDPSWPLLVEQYARACRGDRADGVPEPVDATLAALAVAWSARELATYADGGAPVTLGCTLRVSARGPDLERQGWQRDPSCGCGWSGGRAPGQQLTRPA